MPRTMEVTVFQFDELNDEAKKIARDWYREGALDYDWWDGIYEDFTRIAEMIGIEIGVYTEQWHNVTTKKEGTLQRQKIYFSGFWSQGDGACFEGSYSYKAGCLKDIKDFAPKDTKLHEIVQSLVSIQRKHGYKLHAEIEKIDHHYSHEHTVRVEVTREVLHYPVGDYLQANEEAHNKVTEAFRALMRWLYDQLETEHDYLMSDEQVDESIKANEYEFNEDGSIA